MRFRTVLAALSLAGCGVDRTQSEQLAAHDLTLEEQEALLADQAQTILDQQARIEALEAEVTALTEQIGALDLALGDGNQAVSERLAGIEDDLDVQDAAVATLFADLEVVDATLTDHAGLLSGLREDVDGAAGAVASLEERLYDPDAGDVVGLQDAVTALEAADAGQDARLDAIEGGYATLGGLEQVQSGLSERISEIASDYARGTDLDALSEAHDALSTRVDGLGADMDDVLAVLTPDPAAGRLSIAGDLDVSGTVRGGILRRLQCGGVGYGCSPQACLALCRANDMRMATRDELLAYAASGRNLCAYMWFLDGATNNPMRGYPMYTNRTTLGCGPLDTGDVPRLVGVAERSWDSGERWDCACATLDRQ